jgi:flagellar hook assembly protein FlgD
VFDVAGREVTVLVQGEKAAGEHDVLWTGQDSRGRQVPSGVYFVGLRTTRDLLARRVVLTK